MEKRLLFLAFGLILALQSTSFAQSTKQIRNLIEDSDILADHFTGFALYDCEKKEMIYSQNEDKYFTPASNTKLFTFYTALEMLGDSIPALKYVIKGDSLIFWGTGDPSLYRKDFNSDRVHFFLKQAPQKLFLAYDNYQGNFYGRGWPYGDYDAYYQAEINAFPFAGNLVTFRMDSLSHMLSVYPNYFTKLIDYDYNLRPKRYRISRSLFTNQFTQPNMPLTAGYEQQVPFKTSAAFIKTLLEDTLKRSVGLIEMKQPVTAKTIYSVATDSVLKAMMLPSDNFIAEQLLLVCSSILGDTLSTAKAIHYSEKHFLNDLPQEPMWVDGSGLSRMDLFTPASIVALLTKIQEKIPDENQLHQLFPAGGLIGTLKNAYKTDRGEAFVWAKTGSLTGVHNQSGYIITRKGKRLIYSFMNNSYIRPTAEIRAEMVRIMTAIREKY